MATTKSIQCRFVVKEGPPLTHEPREGVIELSDVVFIMAEPYGRVPIEDRPLQDPDFLSFALSLGTSLEKAQEVADFLDENLESIAITRFGDAQDAARDVMQSERVQRIDTERFAGAISFLRERLAANDVPGTTEALKAIESEVAHLNKAFIKALDLSRAILDKFGKDEDGDA